MTRSKEDAVVVPYRSGFLAAEYNVRSTTNFAGLQLPLEFELSVFMPFLSGKDFKPEEVSMVEVLRGHVSAVESSDPVDDLRPPLGRRAQISHFRIPSGTNSSILITRLNGLWPEDGDEDLRQKSSLASRLDQPKPSMSAGRRTWVLGAMLVLAFVFFSVLFISRNKLNN